MSTMRTKATYNPGDVIFVEQPISLVQSPESRVKCLCCAACGQILGDIDLHLEIAKGGLIPEGFMHSRSSTEEEELEKEKEAAVEQILHEYWNSRITPKVVTTDEEDEGSPDDLKKEFFCSEECKTLMVGKDEVANQRRILLRRYASSLEDGASKSLMLLSNLLARMTYMKDSLDTDSICEDYGIIPEEQASSAEGSNDQGYVLLLDYLKTLNDNVTDLPKDVYFALLQAMETYAWEFKAISPLVQLVESIVDSDLWMDTEVDKKLELLRAAVLLHVGPVVKSMSDLMEKTDLQGTSFAFAQASKPVLIKGVLTPKEIKLIRKESANMASSLPASRQTGYTGSWRTNYLHTNDMFCKQHPDIADKIVEAVKRVDQDNGWCLLSDCAFNMRCVEHHIVKTSGSLPDPTHFDRGSLVTITIMLSDPNKDFEGGEFCTLEKDRMVSHRFESVGNALVFISHKYHSVRPIIKGRREVLVIEFWKGQKRVCPHRCEQFNGPCKKYEQSGTPHASKRHKSAGPVRGINSGESDSHYELEGSAASVVLEHVADVASAIFSTFAFSGRAVYKEITQIQKESKCEEEDCNIEVSFESASPEATVRALNKVKPDQPLRYS